MRKSRNIVVAVALLAGGCGGRVVLDEGSGEGASVLPPLPPTCDAAMEAIDWTACEGVAGPNRRTTTATVCAHEVATKGCAKAAEAYWSCIEAQKPKCVVGDAGVPGSISTNVDAPACDGVLEQLSECLSSCRTAYRCETEGWADCRCEPGAANAGQSCTAWPSLSLSLPDCNVLCSSCP